MGDPQVNSSALSPSPGLREEFQQNHFVLVHNLLSAEAIAGWQARARALIAQRGIDIRRETDGHLLTYRVVTGEVIREHWPELYAFYSDPATSEWIANITGAPAVFLSKNARSAVNINSMSEPGQIYHWHFDATPYTAVLFLTTSTSEDGGELEMEIKDGKPDSHETKSADPLPRCFSILPRAGSLLLMDGSICRHRVARLRRDSQRITVPMVYPPVADDSRPAGLDEYLYKPAP